MSDKPDMSEWAARLEWYFKLADHVSGESWRRNEYLNFQTCKAAKMTRQDLETIFERAGQPVEPIIIHPEGNA